MRKPTPSQCTVGYEVTPAISSTMSPGCSCQNDKKETLRQGGGRGEKDQFLQKLIWRATWADKGGWWRGQAGIWPSRKDTGRLSSVQGPISQKLGAAPAWKLTPPAVTQLKGFWNCTSSESLCLYSAAVLKLDEVCGAEHFLFVRRSLTFHQ